MTDRPATPLLHEYRKGTEAAASADARGWREIEARLFEAPSPRVRAGTGRLVMGGLAAVITIWMLGFNAARPDGAITGMTGAGGSEGASGRARGGGGARGTGGI